MRLWTWPLKAAAAFALLAAAGADVAAHAQPQTPAKPEQTRRSCFRSADVTNWVDVDRTTLNLQVNNREIYQLKLFAPCGDIDFSQRIGLKSRGSDFICDGLDVEVIAPTPTGPETCPATSLRRLTPEEVAALPRRQKP